MATRTISFAGGNWTDTAAWTEMAVPTDADDVVATAMSGNLVVTIGAVCRSANFTDYVGTLSGTATLTIGDGTAGAGNVALTLVAGMTVTYTGAFKLDSGSATQQTIATAGKTLGSMQIGSSNDGNYILSDALSLTGLLTLLRGTLDSNNQSLSIGSFDGGGTLTRTLTLGTSTVTVTGASGSPWYVDGSGFTFSAASSTINLTDTGASAKTFAGAGKTFGTVNITAGGAGAWTFSGNNTFTKLNRSGTGTKTVKFTAGSTTTLTAAGTDGFFSGTAGNVWTIQSTSGGSAWNLSKSSGSVVCDYISLQDSAAAGGATFTPGVNSTNVSGNSGWGFASGPAVGTLAMLGVGK